MGRYLHFRLHPFSVGELLSNKALEAFNRLFEFGGFPESLLEGNQDLGLIWRRG
ncbi:MAG: ATP-binding protein [Myxococcaceae bacterium]|nr:ATP-binding protein [Myxococcaceae bacterium]